MEAHAGIKYWKSRSGCHYKHGLGSSVFFQRLPFKKKKEKETPSVPCVSGMMSGGKLHVCVCSHHMKPSYHNMSVCGPHHTEAIIKVSCCTYVTRSPTLHMGCVYTGWPGPERLRTEEERDKRRRGTRRYQADKRIRPLHASTAANLLQICSTNETTCLRGIFFFFWLKIVRKPAEKKVAQQLPRRHWETGNKVSLFPLKG